MLGVNSDNKMYLYWEKTVNAYLFFIVNLHLALGNFIIVPWAVTFGMCSIFLKVAISSLLRIVQPMKRLICSTKPFMDSFTMNHPFELEHFTKIEL